MSSCTVSPTFRLLPPQQLGRIASGNHIPNGAWIGGGKAAKVTYNGHVIAFPYDPDTNLPTIKTNVGSDKYCCFLATSGETNTNLTASQKMLLCIHHRCGHKSMTEIQQ